MWACRIQRSGCLASSHEAPVSAWPATMEGLQAVEASCPLRASVSSPRQSRQATVPDLHMHRQAGKLHGTCTSQSTHAGSCQAGGLAQHQGAALQPCPCSLQTHSAQAPGPVCPTTLLIHQAPATPGLRNTLPVQGAAASNDGSVTLGPGTHLCQGPAHLVDAGLMGKRVGPHDGLVGLNGHAAVAGHHARGGRQMYWAHPRPQAPHLRGPAQAHRGCVCLLACVHDGWRRVEARARCVLDRASLHALAQG